MLRASVTLFLLLLSICSTNLCECAGRVRLTDVTTLTLHQGQYTTGRRSAPVPQIECVGGSARGQYEPKVVQCYNRGYDGVDVQWECKAEMSDEFEFGKLSISCEGYDYPDDPYVLTGSCGLKYDLEYARGGGTKQAKSKKVPSAPPYENNRDCSSSSSGNGTRRSGWGWDGGPPPPPGGVGPPPPGFKNFARPSGAPPTYEESCSASSTGTQSGGPGFYSGLGLGGLAGYMYGRSQSSRRPNVYERDSSYWSRRDNVHRDSSPTPSTSRTVSGFGGTERR